MLITKITIIFIFYCILNLVSGSIQHNPSHLGSQKCITTKTFKSIGKYNKIKSVLSIKGGFTVNNVPLPVVKLFLQILLSGLNMACWGIPLMNKNFSQNKTVLSRANVYAGGIFLMLSFGHLIPHSLEMFHSAGMESSTILKFTLAGLLAIFFLEKIAFDSHSILHGQSHSAECSIDCDNSHSHTIHDHSHSHFHEIRDKNRVINVLKSSLSDRGNRGTLSTRSALLLLLAMSLHSLFETVALGLTVDRSSAFYMATSIGLHQPAESIALLIAFLKTSMSIPSIVKWLLLFSIIGPIGVTAGVLVQKISTPPVQAIVVAMTAGTFLYLGATEVLNEEFEALNNTEKWIRFAFLLSGIMTIHIMDIASGMSGISSKHHHHHH